MSLELEPLVHSAMNIGSAAIVTYLAILNRKGFPTNHPTAYLRDIITSKVSEPIGKFYKKISPTLEHFAMGYALTAVGYGIDDFFISIGGIGPNIGAYEQSTGKLFGGVAVVQDLLWEGSQAIKRRKVLPEQFLGTCAGVTTSAAINDPQLFYDLMNFIK